ncbi:MAG TPA: alkaline phosphatase family protein [Pyrinomonadaceae bacterium]|nr:alkaline phosphatase family protein [Pyrinomonadaceae bacterium]
MSTNGKHSIERAGETRPRRLLLCLDGVPYEVLKAAKGKGMFDIFSEPARLLSPFPTMTNVALSRMLGATAPLGYESLYFDRGARELRGGVRKYIGWRTPDKSPSSYMDELDYQEPLPFEFLVYVAPETIWRADMKRFHERFRRAPQTRDFFAFLKGTDGLMHIRGPRRLTVALASLDKILKSIHGYCGDETEIVLFSDHGMNLEENKRINLQTHLRKNGYTVTDNLREGDRRGISVPAFGLCSYAALYTVDEEAAAEVADSLVDLEGVDFSVHRDGDACVMVKGSRGTARIHRRADGGTSFRYEQITGDPLHLASVINGLRSEGLIDQAGYAADSAWYALTASHIYPDALANLFSSLHAPRVGHTADVLLSLRDGYFYGDSLFSRLARLAATHGNALRASSTAFMMSTHRQLPTYVRADEAQPLLKG